MTRRIITTVIYRVSVSGVRRERSVPEEVDVELKDTERINDINS